MVMAGKSEVLTGQVVDLVGRAIVHVLMLAASCSGQEKE